MISRILPDEGRELKPLRSIEGENDRAGRLSTLTAVKSQAPQGLPSGLFMIGPGSV